MVEKGWHCAFDAHYHIVFPVKYRKALLNPAVEKKIKEVALEIQNRYDIVMEQIGADLDHIHLLCSFHFQRSNTSYGEESFGLMGTILPLFQPKETGKRLSDMSETRVRSLRISN